LNFHALKNKTQKNKTNPFLFL